MGRHTQGTRGFRADPIQSPCGSTLLETGSEETILDSCTTTELDKETSSQTSIELVPTFDISGEEPGHFVGRTANTKEQILGPQGLAGRTAGNKDQNTRSGRLAGRTANKIK